MASETRRCLVTVRRFPFIRMSIPDFRIGSVTAPTGLAGCFDAYVGVLRAVLHRRRLAAYDPEECKKGNYANSDRKKIDILSIHKAGRTWLRG